MALDILSRPELQPKSSGPRLASVRSPGVEQVSGPEVGAAKPDAGSIREQPTQSKAVDNVVRSLNESIQSVRRELEFTIDKESDRVIVKVLDSETGEVIRQLPPEELLAISRHLQEYVESRQSTLGSDGRQEGARGFILQAQA